jgi:hypothetical protein
MTETYNDKQRGLVDESMMSLSDMVEDMIEPFDTDKNLEEGLAVSLVGIHLDMPVQLQVAVGEDEKVSLGITPPLYKIETSFNPVFHQIRFTCEIHK